MSVKWILLLLIDKNAPVLTAPAPFLLLKIMIVVLSFFPLDGQYGKVIFLHCVAFHLWFECDYDAFICHNLRHWHPKQTQMEVSATFVPFA